MGRVIAVASAVFAACVVAASAAAGGYSVSSTRACLARHGAMITDNATLSLPAKMSAAQRGEVILGTLPDGGAPAYFYLAIGPGAETTLKLLSPIMVPGITASDSWSGTQGNAAWTLASLAGKAPSAAARTTLLACLLGGAATSAPTNYRAARLTTCLGRDGHATAMPGSQVARLARYLFGHVFPPSLTSGLFFVETSTTAQTNDGVGILLEIQRTKLQSTTALRRVERALQLPAPGLFSGSRRNAAWYAYRERHSTSAGIKVARKLFYGCLAEE